VQALVLQAAVDAALVALVELQNAVYPTQVAVDAGPAALQADQGNFISK
jgi:hypothetical protein